MIDQYPSQNGVLTSLIWRKTAAGGETSLSGYDNANQALSYTPGQEQVYLNGILLVRGDDYTATNGTSITGLAALAANDFVQINCYNNFSVASVPATSITGEVTNSQITSLAASKLTGTIANNQLANSAITINGSAVSLGGSTTVAATNHDHDATYINQSTFDAKGDLIVGTADNAYSKLSSSGVNNQVLTIDTATATGLKWAAAASVPTVNWVRLTSGTSWSVPSGIKTATIWCIGGGGGGGGGNNNGNCGGGGGAGGLQMGTFDLSSAAGSTISYSIGSGGNGGAAATTGSVGGDTTFGTSGQSWYLLAKGGGNGRASGGADSSSTAGCGGGLDASGGGTTGGGAGGGLGGNGGDAVPTNPYMSAKAGTQGSIGGRGGNSSSSVAGIGGHGIFINNFGVGGGGMGGNRSGNNYIAPSTTFGSKDADVSGTPVAATANTGTGGAGGSVNGSGVGQPGGAGGSGVIFIQYLS